MQLKEVNTSYMKLVTAYKQIEQNIKPNVFITLSLKQGIFNRTGAYIKGDFSTYNRAIGFVWGQLNRRLYGNRAWRRRTRRLYNLTTLEKGKDGMWHIHSCLRVPDHVTIAEFRDIFDEIWSRSAWSMRIYEIEPYKGGGVPYILKTGQDCILYSPTYF